MFFVKPKVIGYKTVMLVKKSLCSKKLLLFSKNLPQIVKGIVLIINLALITNANTSQKHTIL